MPRRRKFTYTPKADMSESDAQQQLVSWWRDYSGFIGMPEELLFHVPNEGLRSYMTAARMKAEGMRAGIPDLMLAFPIKPFHGLFIEMKRPVGGHVTPKQKEILSLFSRMGYAVKVCHGADEAINALKDYLVGKFPVPDSAFSDSPPIDAAEDVVQNE